MEGKQSFSWTGNPHSASEDLDLRDKGSLEKRGPRRVKHRIAEADKLARTGAPTEPVRDTPPAGKWNDTSAD